MYKVTINTNAYKKLDCDEERWRNGTINDFHEAINGWSIIEPDEQCLRWRIQLFGHSNIAYEDFKTDKYKEWRKNPKNTITYLDKICDFERESFIRAYGFVQGYFNLNRVIKEVIEKGIMEVPFEWFYDARQYLNNLDGCYIEIKAIDIDNLRLKEIENYEYKIGYYESLIEEYKEKIEDFKLELEHIKSNK